jgi:putative hydrolase of HD superfamily
MENEDKKEEGNEKDMKDVANFLYEVGILAKTPRSGFHFLGTGNQSVSEHVSRVLFIGYTLASLESSVDMLKVLKMCLLHDLAETRVSDLNYVHQKYVQREEEKAIEDLAKTIPFGGDVKEVLHEYHERKSKEAVLAKDADNIEWIISLKEQLDNGNVKAKEWINSAMKRLKSDIGKKIGEEILKTSSDSWWFGDKESEWWVSRGKDH